MKSNKFLLALGFSVFFVANVFAGTNDSYLFDLSKIPRKDFVKVHEQYIDFVIEKERGTKYPSFIESKYSWLPNLLEAFPSLISSCYAASSESCVFGGWVSKKRSNGRCIIPWHARVYAKNQNVDDYGPKCGASNLFRCNSTLFGPGPTKDQMTTLQLSDASGAGQNHHEQGGICVDTGGSYKGLTKKCAEMSKKLDGLRGKSWLEEMSNTDFDQYYKNKFEPFKKFVDNFCSSTPRPYGDKTCDSLESRVNNILEKPRLRVAAETVNDLPIIRRSIQAIAGYCSIVEQTVVIENDATVSGSRKLPGVDEKKFDGLMSEKGNCIKGKAKDSKDAQSLYEALAVMMTDHRCNYKISNIKSKQLDLTRSISIDTCPIKLDEKTSDIGGVSLTLTLPDGSQKEMSWDANHLAEMSVQDWLYGQPKGPPNGHVGFYKQDIFKDICPKGGAKVSVAPKDKKTKKKIEKEEWQYGPCVEGDARVGQGENGTAMLICTQGQLGRSYDSVQGIHLHSFFDEHKNDSSFRKKAKLALGMKYDKILSTLKDEYGVIEAFTGNNKQEIEFFAEKYRKWTGADKRAKQEKKDSTPVDLSIDKLGNTILNNSTIIKNVINSKNCSQVNGNVSTLRVNFSDGESSNILPVNMTPIKGKKGHYTLEFIPAYMNTSFYYDQEIERRTIVIPDEGDLTWIKSNKEYSIPRGGLQTYGSFTTAQGKITDNCELKKVVSKVSD